MNDSLQTIVKREETNWRVFPLVFAVVLFVLLFCGGIISFFVVGRFLPSFGLFNQMLILSLAIAAGVSMANRTKALHVDHDALSGSELRDKITSVIESFGFLCHHEQQKCTFRNQRQVHRWFNDWLGTEQIVLTADGNGLLLTGPGRYLNELEVHLRKHIKKQ